MYCRYDSVDVDFLTRFDIQSEIDTFLITYRRTCELDDSIDSTDFIVVDDSIYDTVDVCSVWILEVVWKFRFFSFVDDVLFGSWIAVVIIACSFVFLLVSLTYIIISSMILTKSVITGT